jgi:hypothetical protein
MECGDKLSPKDFRERIREEEALEAERAAAETPGLVDLRNLSPRSRQVYDAVLQITRRELEGERLESSQVIRRVGVALQSYESNLASPLTQMAAPPTLLQMATFNPQLPQSFPPGYQPQALTSSPFQTSPYALGIIPAAAFAPFPTATAHGQQFQGQPVIPPPAGGQPTQNQGNIWQWWPGNQNPV